MNFFLLSLSITGSRCSYHLYYVNGDVDSRKDVMNIFCDVSPSFRAITLKIVAMAFEISRGTDEEER